MGKNLLPKVGLVYREVAYRLLLEEGLPVFEIEQLMQEGQLREIEKHVKVAAILEVASHKLCQCLAKEVKVPRNFFWTIMFSETPRKDLEDLILQLKLFRFTKEQKVNIVIKVLKSIHNEWVRLYGKEFFRPDKTGLRCRYMQFQLIGARDALRYLVYINDLLELIDWKISENALRAAYSQMQNKYLTKHHLDSEETLIDFIASGEYEYLSPQIKRVLKEDRMVIFKMIYS